MTIDELVNKCDRALSDCDYKALNEAKNEAFKLCFLAYPIIPHKSPWAKPVKKHEKTGKAA